MSEDTGTPHAEGEDDDLADIVTETDLVLRQALVLGKETTVSLHLSEPNLGQNKAMQKAGVPADQLAILIGLNARTGPGSTTPGRMLLPAEVDRICQRDIVRIDDFFARFSKG